jgi:hypothetical protein
VSLRTCSRSQVGKEQGVPSRVTLGDPCRCSTVEVGGGARRAMAGRGAVRVVHQAMAAPPFRRPGPGVVLHGAMVPRG